MKNIGFICMNGTFNGSCKMAMPMVGKSERLFFIGNGDFALLIYVIALLSLGIFGNLHAFFIYLLRFKKSALRLFIVSLSLADLTTCVFEIPYYTLWYQNMFSSTPSCQALVLLTTVPSGFSLTVLAFIAIDRYRRVCKPLKKQISKTHVRIGLGIILICMMAIHSLGAALHGSRLVYTKGKYPKIAGHRCGILHPENVTAVALIVCSFSSSIFGMLVSVVMYALIGRKLLKRRRAIKSLKQGQEVEMHSQPNSTHSIWYIPVSESNSENDNNVPDEEEMEVKGIIKSKDKAEKQRRYSGKFKHIKRTVMFAIASLISYTGYILFVVVSVIRSTSSENFSALGESVSGFIEILGRMYILNHAVNPYVYCLMDRKFRNQCVLVYKILFKRMFCFANEK